MKWVTDNIWKLLILAGVILVFIRLGCNGGGIFGKTEQRPNDTVHTTNTVYIQQPPITVKEYVPIQSGAQAPIIIHQN